MWDCPRSEIEPKSPVLADRLCIAPPGSPSVESCPTGLHCPGITMTINWLVNEELWKLNLQSSRLQSACDHLNQQFILREETAHLRLPITDPSCPWAGDSLRPSILSKDSSPVPDTWSIIPLWCQAGNLTSLCQCLEIIASFLQWVHPGEAVKSVHILDDHN